MSTFALPSPDDVESPTILDVLDLEPIDADLFRAGLTHSEPYTLYGGQVAAQALRAAGMTVDADRVPHSLHGYFLRKGDPGRPTVFQVARDRDGRSYSARRVVALQGGKVIFNMSASFSVEEEGPDVGVQTPPEVPAADLLPSHTFPRLFSVEGRLPPQPHASSWPTRVWARSGVTLPDTPLMHACALTYLSDISSGLGPLKTATAAPRSSLDHALWFHRPVRLDDWVLMDLVPHTAARGRGFYSGTFWQAGRLVASSTQEALFR